MKIGIIRERKNPPDRRVVFSPDALVEAVKKFPTIKFKIEPSETRIFADDSYFNKGFEVAEDLSDCDILLGVKEVPIEHLIPRKKYFFFSHTIKKQPYNRPLLQEILKKKIELYDHETLIDENGMRLVGFGRYAGIVGAYNGIRTYGLKFDLFNLPKAKTLEDQEALIAELNNIQLPPIKIVLTGAGKVARGAQEILEAAKIKKVNIEEFLSNDFKEPVYVMIDVLDYNIRRDGKIKDNSDFYNHPEDYISNFKRFTEVSDLFIAGHFFGDGSPKILTREMLNADKNKIKVVADISCDINGPISSTIRASTIENPIYGYSPLKHEEINFQDDSAIAVMAVDNLPCELPKDASEGFGEMFLQNILPAFFDGDQRGILKNSKITENGKLTPRFSYLQDFVDEN